MLHVTTTCPDLDTAKAIARAALEARLAACANILPGVVSLFHWDGKIAQEGEVQVSFKTTNQHRAALVEAITRVHPYDLPVIIWEEVATTPEATAWLDGETG